MWSEKYRVSLLVCPSCGAVVEPSLTAVAAQHICSESWFTKKIKCDFCDRRGPDLTFPHSCLTHRNGSLSLSPSPPGLEFVHGGQGNKASYWSESSSRVGSSHPRPSSRDRQTGSAPRSNKPGEGRVGSLSAPHSLSFLFTCFWFCFRFVTRWQYPSTCFTGRV